MLKYFNWRVVIGIVLVTLSAVVYVIHYLIFRDAHHIFIYLVGDIAFVFIEVLLVTLIIDQLLHEREKKSLLFKLNMIIGIFYSEAGNEILRLLSSFDTQVDRIRGDLLVTDKWSKQDFLDLRKRINAYEHKMDSRKADMGGLKNFFLEKRDFMLRILENPNLLEHEGFTDALWATLHLAEELTSRKSLKDLPKADYGHLS
ncbi:MAG: hypothetical protein NTV99_09105, partial [Deltaproteobacteria bacterium]|nr:hypothetical protein [Deltaproteobacteria bacterium]